MARRQRVCECDMVGEPGHVCRKGARCAGEYQGRLSGPLLDRLDIQIELGAVRAADLTRPAPQEGRAEVAARVARARDRQRQRFARLGSSHLTTNAQADGTILDEIAKPDDGQDRVGRLHIAEALSYRQKLAAFRQAA